MSNYSKIYPCSFEDCKSVFYRPYRLEQHLLTHNNIKAFICRENNCSKSYTNKSHLDRHINSAHQDPNNDIMYSCPTCFKSYANRQNLKRHIKIKHTMRNQFSCDICKTDFKKKNQLSAHMYNHTGIKAFSCNLCPITFVSLYEKKRHMRFHKTYKCDECEMKFDLWSKYQKHKRTHYSHKEFICDTCGRHFKQRNHIVRHVKIHSDKNNIFQCLYDNCNRTYSRKSNLNQHILIKHMKISHECTICKAHLSTKKKLDYHLECHSLAEIKIKQPKTKMTGRKERKDKGVTKTSIALKLAGIINEPENESEVSNTPIVEEK